MSQGQHSPDTAWIIVEPDMCMYAIDAQSRTELIQGRMPAHQFKDYEEFGATIEDVTAKRVFFEHLEKWRNLQSVAGLNHVPWPRAEGSKPDTASRPPPPWRVQPVHKAPELVPVLDKVVKASKEDTTVHRISQELLDLVLYFNASSRLGRGGLLWCGWNATQWSDTSKCRSTSPAAGAHLVMVSTAGARVLMTKRDEIPNMHMGNFLSKLCGLKWQHELGAAYVQPPIGSFFEHVSSTTPGQVLKDHFSAKWAQEGTRPMKESDKPRWICGFTEKGPAAYLHQRGLDFNDENLRRSYYWLTEAPPQVPEWLCGIQEWHDKHIVEEDLPPSRWFSGMIGELVVPYPPSLL